MFAFTKSNASYNAALLLRQLSGRFNSSVSASSGSASTAKISGKKNIRKNSKPMAKRPAVQTQRIRNEELEEKAKKLNLDWRIVTATILHRYPVVTREPEQWEKDMTEVKEKIMDGQRAWLMERVKDTDAQIIPERSPSYEEIIESMPFKPASRITEADQTNDRRSMDRRLQDSLFFIVKRNRSDFSWQFPQGKLLETENNLRAGAERVLDRAVGKIRRWFVGNAPVGHYIYEYPEAMRSKRQNYGAKVYFYRAQWIEGNLKLETKLYKDYAWVARDELKEYFDPQTAEYLNYLLPD